MRVSPRFNATETRRATPIGSREPEREFARGKEPPLTLLLSMPTDVYRLRSASTRGLRGGGRVIAVAAGARAARRLSINRAANIDGELSICDSDSNFAQCIRRAIWAYAFYAGCNHNACIAQVDFFKTIYIILIHILCIITYSYNCYIIYWSDISVRGATIKRDRHIEL